MKTSPDKKNRIVSTILSTEEERNPVKKAILGKTPESKQARMKKNNKPDYLLRLL